MQEKLIVGSRKSQLAMEQTNIVCNKIESLFEYDVEILTSDAIGDIDKKSKLTRYRGQGVFTSKLEIQLLNEDIDIAVHSLKDLPVEQNPGLQLVAYIKRHSAGDTLLIRSECLLSKDPIQVTSGLRFATGSPRRQSQMMDLENTAIPVDIRGNVETRLSRIETGYIDAIVMASAVFDRIDLPLPDNVIRVDLPIDMFPPAPGQGIIAVQAREGEFEELSQLNDTITQLAAKTERAILDQAGGGCELTLGVHLHRQQDLWKAYMSRAEENWVPSDVPTMSRAIIYNKDINNIKQTLQRIIGTVSSEEQSESDSTPLQGCEIIITRSSDGAKKYQKILEKAGAVTSSLSVFEFDIHFNQLNNSDLIQTWKEAEWLVISSQRTIPFINHLSKKFPKSIRVAVVGSATASAAREIDFPVHVVAEGSMDNLQQRLDEARTIHPGKVIYLHGEHFTDYPSDDSTNFPVYSAKLVDVKLPFDPSHIVVFSSRSAKHLVDQLGIDCTDRWVAIGPKTASTLNSLGASVLTAKQPTPKGIYDTITTAKME